MPVELITAFVWVVDRLIQLVDRREKLNKNTFTDFVVPVMTDFDAAHKDYIDSFKRYCEQLKDETILIDEKNPVFEDISRDILLSENLRTKALALSRRNDLDSLLIPFVVSIEEYFSFAYREPVFADDSGGFSGGFYSQTPESFFPSEFAGANVPRSELIYKLSEIARLSIPDVDKRKKALDALDRSIEILQKKYENVFSAFTTLKTKLLSPI